jgi:adenylate kinase family enzyme
MLKIALCGAGGSGKGTLAREISRKFGFQLLPSPNQDVGLLLQPEKSNYKDIQTQSTEEERNLYQHCILFPQIINELNASRHTALGYVSERSVFDYLAYDYKYARENGNTEAFDNYEQLVLRAYHQNPYDVIFFLSSNDFEPQDKEAGKWKERDPEDRKWTNNWLYYYLVNSGNVDKSHVCALCGTVDERLEHASQVIRSFQEQSA